MKTVWTGLESSGKSYMLAKIAVKVAYRNSKWNKQTGQQRAIWSNLVFSLDFYNYCREELGVPIFYWKSLDELVGKDNIDVFIDEIGTYFDSRMWADLSLDVRRWLAQGAKSGVEIYGTAQDFAQVDKSFRRLTNALYEIIKVIGSPRPAATRPPVKRIWGVCAVFSLDPRAYDEDNKRRSSMFPSFMMLEKRYCDIFDTTQKIGRSAYPRLRHEVRKCEHHLDSGGDGSCSFCKVTHV